MKATIHVTLKSEVLDPQGEAIRKALQAQGFSDVGSVRVGKLIEIEAPSLSKDTLDAMCEKLLANRVIEDYHSEICP